MTKNNIDKDGVQEGLDDNSNATLLGYYDLEEIYDYSEPLTPINTRGTNDPESTIIREESLKTKQELREFRGSRMPSRIYKKINQANKDKNNIQIKNIGNLLSFNSESALRLFKNGLTFIDKNGKEVCFFHEIKDSSELPSDITKIFIQYKEEVQKRMNAEAKIKELESKKESSFSEVNIKKIKKEIFSLISNKLFSSFSILIKNSGDLIKKENKSKSEQDLVKSINDFKSTMINLTKEFKEME